ncbi:hypothetical protein K492DRAFT_199542 [Lichtheimia hyalospora FSU 10163]|nr:hypothetical protein K492DRAFT_199542 [Lichtheimia hyalospora FSU 10163]
MHIVTRSLSSSGSNDNDGNTPQSTYFSPEPLSNGDQYMIDGFDVSQAFHQFQASISTTTGNLFMESHAQHILAMSYVLLIKPYRIHPHLVSIFGVENIKRLQDHVRRKFGFGQYGEEFDVGLMLELKNIVRKDKF